MKNTVENKAKLVGVIAKAWMDSEYKERLLTNPKEVIVEEGVDLGETEFEIEAVEDNKSRKNFVIDTEPLPPNVALGVEKLPANPNFYQASTYIYHRCATDKYYRAYFKQHPEESFDEIGYYLPEGFNVVVKENSDKLKYFVLPVKPKVAVETFALKNEVAMFATAPVNANVNINANANVNINGDVNINGGVQVNVGAVAAVVVAVAVLI